MSDKNVNVEKTLSRIIGKAARRPDITLTPTNTFKDFGIDSLEVVQIMVAIEEAFDIDLEDKDLKDIDNMGEFIDYIKKRLGKEINLSMKEDSFRSLLWPSQTNGKYPDAKN